MLCPLPDDFPNRQHLATSTTPHVMCCTATEIGGPVPRPGLAEYAIEQLHVPKPEIGELHHK